jgi:hypothetical protein
MGRRRGALVGLVLAAVLGLSRCERVPLTAPAGSSIYLQANPRFVPANGGRSVVTALVVEPAGTLVPDGTQVLFLTDLGTIDERGETVDGVARVYFVSDARSGTATVTAMSGGPAVTPSASPSASPAAGTIPSVGLRASAVSAPVAAAAANSTGQAQITIEVGAKLPTRVVVGADPQRITSPRWATIVANVYDDSGNPVQNVPVIFKIDSVTDGTTTTTTTTTTTVSVTASSLEESLESGGAPRYTDSSGQAFDTLYTTAPSGGIQKLVVVSATTSNGVTGQVTVAID